MGCSGKHFFLPQPTGCTATAGCFVVARSGKLPRRVPMGSSINGQNPLGTSFLERYHGVFPNQGVGAEMIAEQWGISRAAARRVLLSSHEGPRRRRTRAGSTRRSPRSRSPTAGDLQGRGHPSRRHGRVAGQLKPAFKPEAA